MNNCYDAMHYESKYLPNERKLDYVGGLTVIKRLRRMMIASIHHRKLHPKQED